MWVVPPFLNEQTSLVFSDICTNGTLAGCQETSAENMGVAIALVLVGAGFVVGIAALYVELIGDMSDEDQSQPEKERSQQPGLAPPMQPSEEQQPSDMGGPGQPRSIPGPGGAPAGPSFPQNGPGRMNTSAIFKKAREEKEAAIAELKTQQERDIAALRAEYEKKIASTGGVPAAGEDYSEKLAQRWAQCAPSMRPKSKNLSVGSKRRKGRTRHFDRS